MNWSNIGKVIQKSLPVLGMALTNPGKAVGTLVAGALGVNPNPEEVAQKIQAMSPEQIKFELGKLESDTQIQTAAFEAQQAMLETVNKTIQSEYQADDSFVRRWRPFYGYSLAITWFVQMSGLTFAFTYTAIKNPKELMLVMQQLAVFTAASMPLWGIALAVLGVSVHQRSKDKQTQSGVEPKGLLQTILNR